MDSTTPTVVRRSTTSKRHTTSWIEAGPADGPLLIFLHGWPELSIVWRSQIEHFAIRGWRCAAPDMRGYGESSAPDRTSAYAVEEIVADMIELHDALGARAAVWVGHDWGSAIVWGIAAHHASRCRGVASLCIPYVPRGVALENLIPLVDRNVYPVERYPVGQWDYWLYYREHFEQAAIAFEADVSATFSVLYRAGPPVEPGEVAPAASIREKDGWFGNHKRAPALPRDESMLSKADFDLLVAAFRTKGFRGPNAWYLNDQVNVAYAAEAPAFGRLTLPVLFIHAARDTTCETRQGRLANPMRESCLDLTEAVIDAGHELMLEQPQQVNVELEAWLAKRCATRPNAG